ncbi:hypothetical protein VFPPC_14847 [Pochonia chlamydosporia 170]|uniref:MARVEL domain-containing protein n=1 Tax=Pochonia chlamydosporia 170 TaxID=1380566 RepID=A0A179F0Q9_METCM|nr:hypothetical protein VFPPC_14847 [Pochonia chlamydosporia 170]OAQ58673.2 hypothetical protein VFPPC_14847 [Pochonia chlamydosporia 170]
MASPYAEQEPPTWGPPGRQVAAMAVPMNYGMMKSPAEQLYPPGWITVPILQLIFALISAGAPAYFLATGIAVRVVLITCASVFSIGISIWLICAHSCAPQSLKPMVALPLDFLVLVLWIATVGWMAASAVNLPIHGLFGSIYEASAGIAGIDLILFAVGIIGDSIAIHRLRRLDQGVQFQQYPTQQPNMQPYMQTQARHPGFSYYQDGTQTTTRKPEFEVRSPANPQSMQSPTENAEREFGHELEPQVIQAREMDGKATLGLSEWISKPELNPHSVQTRELAEQDRTAELSETISPASPFSYHGGVSQSPVELPTRPQS